MSQDKRRPRRTRGAAREQREAERRAADRKQSLDSAMSATRGRVNNQRVDTTSQHTGEVMIEGRTAAAFIVVGAVVASVAGGLAVTAGTPVGGNGWGVWGLVLGFVAILFAGLTVNAWSHSNTKGKVASVCLAGVIIASFAIGSTSQVIVDGHPVRSGSVADKSSRLSNELVSDMLTLEDNGALLGLPTEQGRGILGLYEEAAVQSSEIAAKWNPALRGSAPLPGFVAVFSLINQAADLQAQTLRAYAIQIQEPSSTRAGEIDRAKAKIAQLLAGPQGAVAQLSSTVKPIGIDIATEGGQS